MTPKEQEERQRVIAVARSWIGTKFHDNAHYDPQHFMHRDEERFLSYVLPRAFEIDEKDAKPADFVVYRIGRVFAHGAIVIDPGWPHILHAYKSEGFVTVGFGDVGELAPRPRRFFRPLEWER